MWSWGSQIYPVMWIRGEGRAVRTSLQCVHACARVCVCSVCVHEIPHLLFCFLNDMLLAPPGPRLSRLTEAACRYFSVRLYSCGGAGTTSSGCRYVTHTWQHMLYSWRSQYFVLIFSLILSARPRQLRRTGASQEVWGLYVELAMLWEQLRN